MEPKDLIQLLAIFIAAVVILAAARVIFDTEFTVLDVVMLAFFIAIAAIIALRLAAFIMVARDL